MIRRDVPRDGNAESWLLISQIEHARLSHRLAAEWTGLLPTAPPRVREEFLAAVLHHDDGWDDWKTDPTLDPERGRPYGFTEMPTAESQAIWTRSIDACEAIGPFAAWVVASHFIALQSKRDDDFSAWARWLGEQDRRRADWLRAWRTDDAEHTESLAEDGLYLLQAFDWLSLWLCCRAPVDARDPVETLELGDRQRGFGTYTFTPRDGEIEVAPWPFAGETLELAVNASRAAAGVYATADQMAATPTRAAWRLVPAPADA
ncbi:MAG: DUF3891 family protein [Planctomycetota bacterium]